MSVEAAIAQLVDARVASVAPVVRLDPEQMRELRAGVVEDLTEAVRGLMLQHLPDTALVSAGDAQQFLGMSSSTWYRRRSEGRIPPAVVTPAGERWRIRDLARAQA